MYLFHPYRVPKDLPELNESRRPLLERIIRLLESGDSTHIVLRGAAGSGRHTIVHTLFTYGPLLNRRGRFSLDAGELATALYEAADTSEFFRELTAFCTNHRRALAFIDWPDVLIDGVEKHELRRLARFFRELTTADIRCIIVAGDEVGLRFTNVSQVIQQLSSVVEVTSLSADATRHLLVERGNDPALVTESLELVARYLPNQGLPGAALQLMNAARTLAHQRHETVTGTHLGEIISEQRNLPLEAITTRQTDALQMLEEILSKRVIGQSHAVRTVSRVIQRSFVGLTSRDRPIASLLFLGPSGVGKTELAKTLAETLYRSPRSFARIDMSEFSEAHTVQRLIGAPPGYIGYEEGGQLTNPVDSEPYSLVLLDEIEKAHPKVFDIFLQLLDDGRLTDGRGKTVDFRHTIVVATSNVGLPEIVRASERGELHDRENFLRTTLFPLLVGYFRPEFLNRFDAIIVFPPLTVGDLVTIGRAQVETLKVQLAKRGVRLDVTDATLQQLAQRAYQPTFGARPMRRLVQDEIETPIAQRLLTNSLTNEELLTV